MIQTRTTKASGNAMSGMVTGRCSIQMGRFTRASGEMTKKMDMVYFSWRTVTFMRDRGKTDANMATDGTTSSSVAKCWAALGAMAPPSVERWRPSTMRRQRSPSNTPFPVWSLSIPISSFPMRNKSCATRTHHQLLPNLIYVLYFFTL